MPKTKIKKELKFADFSLSTLVLVEFETKVNFEKVNNDELALFYNVEITRPSEAKEDKFFYTCEINSGKGLKSSGEMVVQISATYGVVIDASQDDPETILEIAKKVAGITVWNKYVDLFMIVTSQMQMDFPLLPSEANEVEVSNSADETENDAAI